MVTTVSNRLNGAVDGTPDAVSLERSAIEGSVDVFNAASGVAGAGRIRFSGQAGRTINGLASSRIFTGYPFLDQPRYEVDLPTTSQWWVRFYMWFPALRDPDYNFNEIRIVSRFAGAQRSWSVHETAAGNVGARFQTDDLAATPIDRDVETGTAKAVNQWWRIEMSYDATGAPGGTPLFRIEVYSVSNPSQTPRIYEWNNLPLSGPLQLMGYRVERSVLLQPGDNDASTGGLVTPMQEAILAWDPNAMPIFGADGDYGGETTTAVESFQAAHGLLVDGIAGPETLAAIQLQARLIADPADYPSTVFFSHVAVSDSGPLGPAELPQRGATGGMALEGDLFTEAVIGDNVLVHGRAALGAAPVTASKSVTVGVHGAMVLEGEPVDSTKASTVSLTAEVGVLDSELADASKSVTVPLTGGLALDGEAEVRGIFRATWPPRVTTEILIDDAWEDISEDVYVRDPVHIVRGRADEAAEADPAKLSLTLNNRDGRYSPRNPLSPYYGKLGRNTQIQIRVGDFPEEEPPEVIDNFERTVPSGGWGTATSGQVWTELGSVTAPYSVSGGRGRMAITQNNFNYFVALSDEEIHPDFDAYYTAQISHQVEGFLVSGVYAGLLVRDDGTGRPAYSLDISFRSAEGMSGGAGRVMASILNLATGQTITPLIDVPTVNYTPGVPLQVRVQGLGPNLRLRVWNFGEEEPEVWHAQGWDDTYTEGGVVGFLSSATADVAIQSGLEVSYGDLTVSRLFDDPDVVRFTGQVAAWPIRWDVSDTDVWVNLEAAGPKRRLGQGSETVRSAMYNAITATHPVAYWPLEDGSQTRIANSASPQTPDMRIIGARAADNDELATSLPLPTYGRNARLSVAGLPTTETGEWELNAAVYLSMPDAFEFGSSPPESSWPRVLEFETSTFGVRIYVLGIPLTDGADPSFFLFPGIVNLDTGVVSAPGSVNNWINLDTQVFEGRESWMILDVRGLSVGSTAFVQAQLATDFNQQVSSSASVTYTGGNVGRIDSIQTSASEGLEGSSIGHIAVWDGLYSAGAMNGFLGYAGEAVSARMSRVSGQNGIPMLLRGDAPTRMGIEFPQTPLELLEEAAATDYGILDERRAGLTLNYRSRTDMYNQDPVIEFDYANGEINPPIEPTDDDQNLRNVVTVQRQEGAQATASVQSGPLGVNTVGAYTESTTLSLATDADARQQAGWRLHMGQVDELRWPLIHINLANRRLGTRVEDILNLDVGDRIRILNPPVWTQHEHLDLIVQGYEETINLFQWDIMLTCTPASPWNVGTMGSDDESEVGPDEPSRADTAGSILGGVIGPQTTQFLVETVAGPTWVTSAEHPDSLPFHITVGGEIMEVTDIVSDTQVQEFTVVRSVNGVVKPHAQGDAVRLANPAIVAL